MKNLRLTSVFVIEKIGLTPANLSILKTGKAKALKIATLESLCEALDCQSADLLEFRKDKTG
ncbi:helix-turn-helix domain-containing protein [Sphingobacterium siyangense]|uniref:helix-turn-helix domain-containing protein n=1 Tax=Sphingobacterium TaxID=28453 RepID=UPI000957E79E|nr:MULTISPECIES: helix-turn-helix domain-containing protein [Sphingobacterium]APU95063.1 transcriptional regulator [Sphingobacterium sp. B29]UQA75381.1 helix-turn-helix domain-containing protein [Sphingobacterium siyangense]